MSLGIEVIGEELYQTVCTAFRKRVSYAVNQACEIREFFMGGFDDLFLVMSFFFDIGYSALFDLIKFLVRDTNKCTFGILVPLVSATLAPSSGS
jgi:hypothetical protein